MNENRLDNLFRDNLNQHASKVPEDMWARINKEQSKRRRILFFRWWSLSILSGLIFTGIIFIEYRQSEIPNLRQSSGISKNKIYEKQDRSGEPSQTGDAGIISTPKITSQLKKNSFGATVLSKDDSARQKASGIIKTLPQKRKAVFPLNNTERNNKKIIIPSAQLEKEENNKPFKALSPATDLLPADQLINDKEKEPQTNANNSISKNIKTALNDTINSDPQEITPLPAEDKVPVWVELYISPDIAFSKITAPGSDYAALRKEAASFPLSFTIGAGFGVPFKNGLSLKTGFQYTQINESFNIYDSALQANKISSNKYKSTDLPIMLGYKVYDKKIQFLIQAGLLVNIQSTYSGKILDAFNQPVSISNAQIYKKNTALSLVAGGTFALPVKDPWVLFAQPYFRYRLKSITGIFEPFDQKIHSAGLSFGVRYNIY